MFPPARGSGAGGAGDTARGRGSLPGAAARRQPPRGTGSAGSRPRREDVRGGAQEAVSQSQPGKGAAAAGWTRRSGSLGFSLCAGSGIAAPGRVLWLRGGGCTAGPISLGAPRPAEESVRGGPPLPSHLLGPGSSLPITAFVTGISFALVLVCAPWPQLKTGAVRYRPSPQSSLLSSLNDSCCFPTWHTTHLSYRGYSAFLEFSLLLWMLYSNLFLSLHILSRCSFPTFPSRSAARWGSPVEEFVSSPEICPPAVSP